jgi:hypothetical protein
MSVVTLPRQATQSQAKQASHPADEPSPTLRLAAGGTLLAGAVLLLAGKRKAGLAFTAAGTALTLLHEKETTLRWWAALPLLLSNTQRWIGQAQGALEEVNTRRQKFQGIFRK